MKQLHDKTTHTAALLLLALAFPQCDILDEHPQSVLTPEGYYTTAPGVETLLNGCYVQPRNMYSATEHLLRMTEAGTDIFVHGDGGSEYLDTYQLSAMGSPAMSYERVWEDCYIGINGCNTLIHALPEVTGMDAGLKKTREGEARFLRAYMYYILVMQFGDVHLTLEPSVGVVTTAGRRPVAEIFDQVIYPDLDFAIANLPAQQPDYGRIDRFGARFFKSYCILSDERATQANFREAARLADSVYAPGSPYALQPDRFKVFNQAYDRNKEIIWSFQYAKAEEYRANETHMYFTPVYYDFPTLKSRSVRYGRSYNRFRPTEFMTRLYDPSKDARYAAYWRDTWYAFEPDAQAPAVSLGDTALYIPYDTLTKAQIDARNYVVVNPEFSPSYEDGPFVNGSYRYKRVDGKYFLHLRKFDDTLRATVNEAKGSRDWVMFRVAEAYLLAAEAYLRAGDRVTAAARVNVLRENAALPGKESAMHVSAVDINIDFILDERARELCGEGKRWFDLKRTGKLLERVKKYNPWNNGRYDTDNIQDFHVLRPIPQSHIDRCSNVYPQNFGY
jgi:hypothetical protein